VTPLTTRQGVIPRTGEVVEVEFPATQGRRRKGRRKMFALVDLESLEALELTGFEWRVLRKLMRSTNPETNRANCTIAFIAREMGVRPSVVSRAMKELRDRRIVASLDRGVHRVNPHIMFRGSNQDWDLATDTTPEPIWSRA
jgi:DNA-binding transcriptional ArsR family regulator